MRLVRARIDRNLQLILYSRCRRLLLRLMSLIMILMVIPMDNILSVSLHCKRLSCTSRSIDKYGAILSIDERVAEHATIDFGENFTLS